MSLSIRDDKKAQDDRFDEVIRECKGAISHALQRIPLIDRPDVEQEIKTKVWLCLPSFDPNKKVKLSTFVIMIANGVIDKWIRALVGSIPGTGCRPVFVFEGSKRLKKDGISGHGKMVATHKVRSLEERVSGGHRQNRDLAITLGENIEGDLWADKDVLSDDVVSHCYDVMNDKEKKIVSLLIYGCTQTDIARQMGCTVNNICYLLRHNIKPKIRKVLEECNG